MAEGDSFSHFLELPVPCVCPPAVKALCQHQIRDGAPRHCQPLQQTSGPENQVFGGLLTSRIFSHIISQNLSSQLHEEEIKPSLVRKVSREIVYSITSQHYHEKSWVDSLWKMLNQLLILQLPFPIEPYLLDVVSERMTISNDSIQLSLSLQVVLKILRSKEYIVEWITPGLTLIGQHFEKMMSCPPKILSKAVVDVVYYLKRYYG